MEQFPVWLPGSWGIVVPGLELLLPIAGPRLGYGDLPSLGNLSRPTLWVHSLGIGRGGLMLVVDLPLRIKLPTKVTHLAGHGGSSL